MSTDTIAVDTTLFVVALLLLFGLITFVIYDYYLRLNERTTLSKYCHALVEKYRCLPIVWVGIGAVVGFSVGLTLGFILGHLFWQ